MNVKIDRISVARFRAFLDAQPLQIYSSSNEYWRAGPLRDVLRKKRMQQRVLQRTIATAIGCDVNTIGRLERGYRAPSHDLLQRWIKYLV